MPLVAYLAVVVFSLLVIGETVRWLAMRAEERRWQLSRNAFSAIPASVAGQPTDGSTRPR